MSDFYLKSGAAGAADGSSWTDAFTTMTAAAAGMSVGDRLFVSHQHAESQASAMTVTFPGTPVSPNTVLCVNDGATPPTTLATTATVTTTGGSAMVINGSLYGYGITFSAGSGAVNSDMTFMSADAPATQTWEECTFIQGSTAASAQDIAHGGTLSQHRSVFWRNCRVKFGSTGSQRIGMMNCNLDWRGGSVVSGSATPSSVFLNSNSPPSSGRIEVSGVDFSNFGSSVVFFSATAPSNSAAAEASGILRNCRLPASWAGSLVSGTFGAPMLRYEMHNCDSADTNYRLWVEGYEGSIKHESTIVKTGSDSAQSIKMVSAGPQGSPTVPVTSFPTVTLKSPEISRFYTPTGSPVSPITVTVDIVQDGGSPAPIALKDDEIWLEVQYLGTSGVPLASFLTDCKGGSSSMPFGDALEDAADQTASSATWSGTTQPTKQKLEVTFTPQEAGYIHAVVHLAKPGTTVYVDPDLQIS